MLTAILSGRRVGTAEEVARGHFYHVVSLRRLQYGNTEQIINFALTMELHPKN
jgi:hypothetical protein